MHNRKYLIIHADDMGMCHSVNAATFKAMTDGVVSSGSVMVPCPWFPEAAAWSREHPEADLGIHLTLTSEWRYYRWRPVAPLDRVPSLVDDEGFMWRSAREVIEHGEPEEVEVEVRAQIERALAFGMEPTHTDSHMGTLFYDLRFFEIYVRVSREYGIPPMLMRLTPEQVELARRLGVGLPERMAAYMKDGPYLDRLILSAEGKTPEERTADFYRLLGTVTPGVTQIIVHLMQDDEEGRNIAGSWQQRYYEFLICTAPETASRIEELGITPVGHRELKDLRSM
ncbi:MAG: polysaccharide deacetylase family protein [Limnochordia bacterium]|jgi:predicted glycoside hydrolase/deacetylase ChbG (UPF0249 family)